MNNILSKYDKAPTTEYIKTELDRIKKVSDKYYTVENLKKIFSLIDLTSLNATDTIPEESTNIPRAISASSLKPISISQSLTSLSTITRFKLQC